MLKIYSRGKQIPAETTFFQQNLLSSIFFIFLKIFSNQQHDLCFTKKCNQKLINNDDNIKHDNGIKLIKNAT